MTLSEVQRLLGNHFQTVRRRILELARWGRVRVIDLGDGYLLVCPSDMDDDPLLVAVAKMLYDLFRGSRGGKICMTVSKFRRRLERYLPGCGERLGKNYVAKLTEFVLRRLGAEVEVVRKCLFRRYCIDADSDLVRLAKESDFSMFKDALFSLLSGCRG